MEKHHWSQSNFEYTGPMWW